jgi:hypothetical protein
MSGADQSAGRKRKPFYRAVQSPGNSFIPASLHQRLAQCPEHGETIIGQIKEFSSLNLSTHRSFINAFVYIIAAITAYQINPIKPKLILQPRYYLETTA